MKGRAGCIQIRYIYWLIIYFVKKCKYVIVYKPKKPEDQSKSSNKTNTNAITHNSY
jgi:hypothetical protein